MNHVLFMIVLGMNVALPSLLSGQTTSLSLSECLDRARQHSYLLKSQNERIRAIQAAQQTEKSHYYPYFSAELTHYQLFFPPYNYRQQFGSAALDWSPGDWLERTALAAARQVEVQQAEKQQVALDLVRRVSALYLGILRDQQELTLLARRLRILAEHRQVAEALWQAGVRTELDVLQIRTAINSLLEQRKVRQAETQNLQSALRYLLNLPSTSTLQLQDIPSRAIEVQPDTAQTRLTRNPLLKSLRLQAETRQLHLREVQASKWPHLQIRSGYVVDRDPTAEGDYWQAGIGIQVPLFRWGETKFRRQEIEAQVQALHCQLAQAQREMRIQLARIAQELSRLRETYRLQQERQQITQQALRIATANYQAGLITNLEYLDAQKENVTTQVTVNETRLAYVLLLIENYVMTNQPEKIRLLQGAQR